MKQTTKVLVRVRHGQTKTDALIKLQRRGLLKNWVIMGDARMASFMPSFKTYEFTLRRRSKSRK